MAAPFFSSQRTTDDGRVASERSVVLARRGVVCTSQPLASQAGLAVLREGGNAFDAAVTAAAVLGVVEPYNTGVGGDCFALCWSADERAPVALNGSGRAPHQASADALRSEGLREMPRQGIHTVTVPGAVSAWAALLDRFGSRSLARALEPAIELAEAGFAVSEVIAHEWDLVVQFGFLQNEAARECFAPTGRAPRVGELVRFPALAGTLRAIAEGGREEFYQGQVAAALLETLKAEGGVFEAGDFAEARSDWVTPIEGRYRGFRVCEIPPNTQGITALIALGVLDHLEPGAPGSPEDLHTRIEAVKLAFADRGAHVADPEAMHVTTQQLLDPASLASLAAQIVPGRAAIDVPPRAFQGTDTVYLTAADDRGNLVSFINSLYGPFGSGLVAGDTGVVLQNRGRAFSLQPGHPGELAGRKRPFHTLCPALILDEDGPLVSFGVMGGDVQAQAHVQVVSNLIDHGMNPQEALDAARFHYLEGANVALEAGLGALGQTLASWGHVVHPPIAALGRGGFGGGQMIARDPATGVLWAGSDRRKDGLAAGY